MGKHNFDFDYIVVGGGPAGSTIALGLARAKKRVAIIEAKTLGGPDLNYRNTLFDTGLKFSRLYHEANLGARYGISNFGLHFNLPTMLNRQSRIIESAYQKNLVDFETAGVTIISGVANFLSNTEIAVDGKCYTARKFIIATGAKLKKVSIAGFGLVPFLTPEQAIQIRRLPKVVTIVGGGATGCELAQYFADLGSKVILFEMSDRILPREDKEVGEIIAKYFAEKMGIVVLTGTKVVAIERDDLSSRVVFTDGGTEKMVRTETIVMATGYEPETDLGLENAHVKYKQSGILVNKEMLTTAKNIYAVGDVTSVEDSSTEKSSYQASVLLSNIISKTNTSPNYSGFSRIVKTYPVVATAGFNEDDLLKRDLKYKKVLVPLTESVSSITEDFADGFVKLIIDKKDVLIGATIVAPNADLLIQELSFAIRNKCSIQKLAAAPHIAGTFGEVIKLAAKKLSH